jgi:hypothetical protein
MFATSFVIMHSGVILCALSFLRTPPICMNSLFVWPWSYWVALDVVPYVVSVYFSCTCGAWVFFFFPV